MRLENALYVIKKMKFNLIHKHKNTINCIAKQEELYGTLPSSKCRLCKLKVKNVNMDKHENSKKCLDRQELLNELMEE